MTEPDDSEAAGPTRPTLVHLATVTVLPGERHRIDGGPFGSMVIPSIAEGRWEGERLRATVVGAGADWARRGPSGVMLLDVRQTILTDDGATVYVSYNGRFDPERSTYTIAPSFETGDERYAWLNCVQAIARGSYVDGRMRYEMFEVR